MCQTVGDGGSVGGTVGGTGLRSSLLADFVGRLVHEGFQGVVKSDHKVGMVDGRLRSGEDGRERLVSVSQNVVVLVSLPDVEDFSDVQVVRVFVLLAKVFHERTLEADFIVAIFARLLSSEPVLSIGDHSIVRGELDVTHDHVSDPQGRLIEHGVGVVLILGADVEKLVAAPAEEQASLVEVGREQSVPAFESELISEVRVCMKISGTEKNGVNFST